MPRMAEGALRRGRKAVLPTAVGPPIPLRADICTSMSRLKHALLLASTRLRRPPPEASAAEHAAAEPPTEEGAEAKQLACSDQAIRAAPLKARWAGSPAPSRQDDSARPAAMPGDGGSQPVPDWGLTDLPNPARQASVFLASSRPPSIMLARNAAKADAVQRRLHMASGDAPAPWLSHTATVLPHCDRLAMPVSLDGKHIVQPAAGMPTGSPPPRRHTGSGPEPMPRSPRRAQRSLIGGPCAGHSWSTERRAASPST